MPTLWTSPTRYPGITQFIQALPGWKRVELTDRYGGSQPNEKAPADLAILWNGARGNLEKQRIACGRMKVPTIILEHQPWGRDWKDSIGVYGNVLYRPFPGKPAEDGYAQALQPYARPDLELPDVTLVLGQVAYDSQHNLDNNRLAKWLANAITLDRKAHPQALVQFRPHPSYPQGGKELQALLPDLVVLDHTAPLAAALQAAGRVLTYNSTAAIEALRYQLPVLCDKTAFYSACCGTPGTKGRWTADRVLPVLAMTANMCWELPKQLKQPAFDEWLVQNVLKREPED